MKWSKLKEILTKEHKSTQIEVYKLKGMAKNKKILVVAALVLVLILLLGGWGIWNHHQRYEEGQTNMVQATIAEWNSNYESIFGPEVTASHEQRVERLQWFVNESTAMNNPTEENSAERPWKELDSDRKTQANDALNEIIQLCKDEINKEYENCIQANSTEDVNDATEEELTTKSSNLDTLINYITSETGLVIDESSEQIYLERINAIKASYDTRLAAIAKERADAQAAAAAAAAATQSSSSSKKSGGSSSSSSSGSSSSSSSSSGSTSGNWKPGPNNYDLCTSYVDENGNTLYFYKKFDNQGGYWVFCPQTGDLFYVTAEESEIIN